MGTRDRSPKEAVRHALFRWCEGYRALATRLPILLEQKTHLTEGCALGQSG
jgi:hypothetical protein